MFSRSVLVSAALVLSLPLPIQAHDIYSDLVDASGQKCCNDGDCQPAPYRHTREGLQMLVDRRWIDVPVNRIQYKALLGDTGKTAGGHWCGAAYEPDFNNLKDLYVTRCAILPPNAASLLLRATPRPQ